MDKYVKFDKFDKVVKIYGYDDFDLNMFTCIIMNNYGAKIERDYGSKYKGEYIREEDL